MGRIPLRDLAIAVGVAVLLLAGALSEDNPEPLGLALVVVGGLVLAAGRQAPIAVVAVTAASVLGYQALGVDVPAVAYLFAVYVGFRAGHRAVTVAVTVAMVVALPIVLVLTQDMMVEGVHTLATEKGITHIWRVDTNAHDTGAMSSNFYHFAQKLFK